MDLESMKKVWEAYLEVTEKKLSPAQKKHFDKDNDGDIDDKDMAMLNKKKKEESSCNSKTRKEEKMKCPKCDGKGCDHCDDTGYHMKEEAPADCISGAPARKGDKKNSDKMQKEFVEVLERAVASPDSKHTKGATKPEGLLDKESPKSKEFVDMHKVDNTYTDFEEKGHDDVAKAGRAVKSQASSRRGDNLGGGDSKSPEKVKDNS